MGDQNLRPWRFPSIAVGTLGAFLLSIAAAMVLSGPRLKGGIALQAAVTVLGLTFGAVVGAWLMLWRYWRHVLWETEFWAFVSEPEPPYEEARLAWLWARRLRVAGFIHLGVFLATTAGMILGLL